jgi:hypothetical protein
VVCHNHNLHKLLVETTDKSIVIEDNTVFTTIHLDKLDPVVIWRGRMNFHIEMPYCRFNGFRTLNKNYLGGVEHLQFDATGRCSVRWTIIDTILVQDIDVVLG